MARATVLTILISLLVGMLLIEAFLRYDDFSPLTVDYIYHDWDGRERRVMVSAEQLDDPRSPIVILGDSMVAGVNCGFEQNLVGHFEAAMQPSAADFKALNLGSANTSVYAYLDQLRGYEAAHGAPDGLIVMLYANDIDVIEPRLCPAIDAVERANGVTPAEKEDIRAFCEDAVVGEPAAADSKGWFSIGGPLDLWLYDVSYAYRFFRESAAQIALRMSGEPVGRLRYPDLWADPESPAFRLIAAGLEEIKALAVRDDVPMLVAFYPPVEFLARENPMYAATEVAADALGERLNVPVLNGFDAYLDDPRAKRNMSRSLTDHHPTCIAHRILAEWLAAKFEEAGGFRLGAPEAGPTLSGREASAILADPAAE